MTDTTPPPSYTIVIEYRPIDDIQPHPENPKGHDLDELVASTRRFGFTEPLLHCGRTGLLAAGHGRLEMTKRERDAGNPPPAGVHVGTDGAWYLPVAVGWSSVDDTELRAYLVASNAIGPRAGFINDLLAPILSELAAGDRGLVGIGMGLDDLETVLAGLGAGELGDQDTDADYAARPERGAPADPRHIQGLHEVGLMFNNEGHAEFLRLLAQLRARWDHDMPTSEVVLRAMGQVVEA
jgi:ParB-like chromosome segregation protein Spo0J